MRKRKLLRITTVPISLHLLLKGQLQFMQSHGFDVFTVSSSGDEVRMITAAGIPHQVVRLTRTISPLSDIIAVIQLIAVILKFRPDIVHTHTPKAGLLGMMASWLCRVPQRLHTVAGLPLMESTGVKKQILILTEKATYLFATKVYPNSVGLRDYIFKKISSSRKIKVLGHGSTNGIDSGFFRRTEQLEARTDSIRQKFDIRRSELVFSFVGRLVRDKGVVELLEAFHRVEKEMPARLLVIGSFENETSLGDNHRQMIMDSQKVIHAGFQDDIRPWLMASDIFVFPSYREGFPNAVMQAACLELPCIVSDINGCNEIIHDQKSGLVVPPKDTEALYLAMKKMASDPSGRKEFASMARAHVIANFDQQFIWNELMNEYNWNQAI